MMDYDDKYANDFIANYNGKAYYKILNYFWRRETAGPYYKDVLHLVPRPPSAILAAA